uniref:Uncharacterized protein n=1 Tax=Arundo donax TaxID=35708 RepID=A0A0A9FT31_ARUDO
MEILGQKFGLMFCMVLILKAIHVWL